MSVVSIAVDPAIATVARDSRLKSGYAIRMWLRMREIEPASFTVYELAEMVGCSVHHAREQLKLLVKYGYAGSDLRASRIDGATGVRSHFWALEPTQTPA